MKIVAGASIIAGAVALDIFSAGAASVLSGAIGDVAAAVLTGGTASLAIGGLGAELLLSGVSQALGLNNTGQTAIGSHAPFRPWQIVYGRQRVSGDTIDLSLSDGGNGDNRWLWEVQVLAAHRVSGIHATYLNQQQAFCRTGTNGLAGNLVGSSNTDNGNMDIPGMVLDIHPTDLNFREYSNFYFDGNPRFWMAQYDGQQTVADPFYVANCANATGGKHWDSTCIVQGMAYSLNRYWSNANWAAGKPNVRYDVSGKCDIYDPRTGAYGYTENAALVLADYMMNQQYGMQYSIADFDLDTLIAAANICDETITLTNSQIIFNTKYTTEARYAINGTVSTSEEGGSVVTQMLGAMAGRIAYVGGKWYIFPGAFQGVAGPALTETNLLAPIDWKPTRKARDIFNEVRATFTCPSGWDTTYAPGFDVYNTTAQTVEDNFNGQWNQIDIPPMCFNSLRDYGSDPYLAQDNNVKYIRNTQYPYTISVATAQRLAKIELLRNRWQGTGTLKLPITYLGVMPNDILTITYPRFGWNSKQLEVQATHIDVGSPGENGEISAPTITLDVAEVDASQYAWLATDELKLQGGQALSGTSPLIVPPPTGVTLATGAAYAQSTAQAGVFVPGLNVKWTAPADASVVSGGKIFIQCAPVGATSIPTVAIVDGNTTSFTITGLNNYTNYQVQLFCENTRGIYSQTTTPVDIVVTAGEIPPPTALTGLTAALVQVELPGGTIYTTATVSLAWTESSDPAVISNGFIQIWCQPAGGANRLIASVPGSATQYSYMTPSPGTYAFSIVAVDVWGNKSPATAQVSIAVTTSAVSAISAQTTADAALGAVPLQNPNFAAGNVGWTLQTGWQISSAFVPNPISGSADILVFSGTATAGAYNNQVIACNPGNIIALSALMKAADAGCTGRLQLQIEWFSATGANIQPTARSAAATISDWTSYRVVGTAPAGAVRAKVSVAITGPTTTDWWGCCGFAVAFQPNSADEIPGGSKNYFAIEETSDQTINHFQTISGAFPAATTPLPYNETTTLGTINIQPSSTEDIFTVWIAVDLDDQNDLGTIAVNVDGGTTFGFSAGQYPYFFMGSITGLSPGNHSLNITFHCTYQFGGDAVPGAGIAMIQQICSAAGGMVNAPVGGTVILKPHFA